MNILLTGGCGFLGARLAEALLARGSLSLRGAASQPIERITLTDRALPSESLRGHPLISYVQGDLLELLQRGQLPMAEADLVVHLAAAVSGDCEADFDLGLRSNVDATRLLLNACRAGGRCPAFVFASSIAVFGKLPGRALSEPIEDESLPTPQSSYGIQKFICEQLVADYGRKGFVAARNVRLMTVSVRPGKPNGAASGFLSGMIREPLAGLRATVPVPPETVVALASPARTIEGILRAAEASDADWGPLIALNLPSLRTTVGEMAAALERVAGRQAAALLDWTVDQAVERMITSWPGRINWTRASGLGLQADADFESVVRDYLRENPASAAAAESAAA